MHFLGMQSRFGVEKTRIFQLGLLFQAREERQGPSQEDPARQAFGLGADKSHRSESPGLEATGRRTTTLCLLLFPPLQSCRPTRCLGSIDQLGSLNVGKAAAGPRTAGRDGVTAAGLKATPRRLPVPQAPAGRRLQLSRRNAGAVVPSARAGDDPLGRCDLGRALCSGPTRRVHPLFPKRCVWVNCATRRFWHFACDSS